MKTVLIHYFTGTGNTLHVVNRISKSLEQKEYIASYIDISKGEPIDNTYDLNIFAAPVYGFDMPELMIKYLKSLKYTKKQKAAIICVGGHTGKNPGYEGIALHHAKSILLSKGYDVYYTNFVSYPDNWTQLTNPPDEAAQERIFLESDKIVELIAEDIGSQNRIFKIISFFNIFWAGAIFAVFTLVGRKVLGKFFTADSTCNSCKKCERTCPAGIIKMVNSRPNWNWKCQGCNRCINICPSKSIQTSILRLVVLGILSNIPLVYFLINISNRYVQLSQYSLMNVVLNILLGSITSFGALYFLDKLICWLESNKVMKKFTERSLNRNFRRYTAPGFNPEKRNV